MFFPVLFSIISLSILMGFGFVGRKVGMINDTVSDGLSGILVNIAMPSFIIVSMQQEFSIELLQDGGIVFVIFVAAHLLLAALAEVLARVFKIPHARKGVFLFALTFGNVGFMGTPVVGPLFGDAGLFYITITNVVFCLLVPLLGMRQIRVSVAIPDAPPQKRRLKINMPFLSAIVGMALFLTSTMLPGPVYTAIRHASNSMMPISMIAIGGMIAKMNMRMIFSDKGIFVLSGIKLLILPIIFAFVLRLFISDPVIIGVVVCLLAMPAPTLLAIFAEQQKTAPDYATSVVLISTVLSLLTLPIVSLFL